MIAKTNKKTILVGVDYTPSSANAVKYAAMLAEKNKLSLTVFHVFDVPIVNTYSGAFFISYSDLELSNQLKLNKYVARLRENHPKIQVSAMVTSKNVKTNIKELGKRNDIFCVVMGLETKSKLSKFIYGSTGTDIAGRIDFPVIIVPKSYTNHKLNLMALAVDNKKSINAPLLKKTKELQSAFKCKIKYVHIRTPEEILPDKKIETKKISLEQIEADDFASGLTKFDKQNDVDLNVIVSHSHSPFYYFFVETNTKTIAFSSKIPILAIHY